MLKQAREKVKYLFRTMEYFDKWVFISLSCYAKSRIFGTFYLERLDRTNKYTIGHDKNEFEPARTACRASI
jgi:hypothetical protein